MMSMSVYSEYQCVSYYTCLSSQAGKTALMKAVFFGETEIVAELVKGGADLNLQNEVCLIVYATLTYTCSDY